MATLRLATMALVLLSVRVMSQSENCGEGREIYEYEGGTAGSAGPKIDCPCLCGQRNDGEGGPATWWNDNYCGPDVADMDEYEQESNDPVCSTTCMEAADSADILGECADIVDYRFCARNLYPVGTTPAEDFTHGSAAYTAGGATEDATRVQANAKSANDCFEASSLAHYGNKRGEDCKVIVKQAACWLAFPRCEMEDGVPTPYKSCFNTCTVERSVCRQMSTYFGAFQQIDEGCSENDNYSEFRDQAEAEEAGGICTGSAPPLSTSLFLLLALLCCSSWLAPL